MSTCDVKFTSLHFSRVRNIHSLKKIGGKQYIWSSLRRNHLFSFRFSMICCLSLLPFYPCSIFCTTASLARKMKKRHAKSTLAALLLRVFAEVAQMGRANTFSLYNSMLVKKNSIFKLWLLT